MSPKPTGTDPEISKKSARTSVTGRITVHGNSLRAARERAFLSHEELAEKADITAKRIQDLERGGGRAYFKTVRQLAKALNIEPSSIIVPAATEDSNEPLTSGDSGSAPQGPRSELELFATVFKRLDAKALLVNENIRTGFIDIDAMTSGLHKGEVTIIHSRPATDAPTVCLSIGKNMLLAKYILFFALPDWDEERVALRLVAAESRVPLDRILVDRLTGTNAPRVSVAIGQLGSPRLWEDILAGDHSYFDFRHLRDMDDLHGRLATLKNEQQFTPDVIIVMSVSRIVGDNTDNHCLEETIKQLKSLAKKEKVAVLATLNDALPLPNEDEILARIQHAPDAWMFTHRDESVDPSIVNVRIVHPGNGVSRSTQLVLIDEWMGLYSAPQEGTGLTNDAAAEDVDESDDE